MSEPLPKTLPIERCQCPYKNCRIHQFQIGCQHGLFYQGSGFTLELATEIKRRYEVHEDMLEALRGVVRVADRATVEFDAARAAIARAEGGT